MAMTDYSEERYDDTVESVQLALPNGRAGFRPGRVLYPGASDMLYVRQGNDWAGRGAIEMPGSSPP